MKNLVDILNEEALSKEYSCVLRGGNAQYSGWDDIELKFDGPKIKIVVLNSPSSFDEGRGYKLFIKQANKVITLEPRYRRDGHVFDENVYKLLKKYKKTKPDEIQQWDNDSHRGQIGAVIHYDMGIVYLEITPKEFDKLVTGDIYLWCYWRGEFMIRNTKNLQKALDKI